jgi:AcrR family transcriptional regulator
VGPRPRRARTQTTGAPGVALAPAWKDRAVARSLERARVEAGERSERIVAAAMEAAAESPSGDFTLQAVVERAGISTRTLYQHFSGKDDLLVAMFEEAQRTAERAIRREVERESDPLERLRAFVVSRQALLTPSPLARLLVQHHFRLQESHPDELRHAVAPVTSLLARLITDAAAAGQIRVDDVDKAATLVFQGVTTAMQHVVLGSSPTGIVPSADDVWAFCLSGLGG